MTPDERVDWVGVKRCLSILNRETPTFLSHSLLIGGAACWFYRTQLEAVNDPDFKLPEEATAENLWLSKDIDFTGIFRADAYEMLSSHVENDPTGNRILKVGGIRIGFAQVGVTFDPEEAFQRARVGRFPDGTTTVQFLVIDPVTLYREKQALAAKRNQPNDHAHLAALTEFLCAEVTKLAESYVQNSSADLSEQNEAISFLLEVKGRAPEILQDPRLSNRIKALPASDRTDFLHGLFL
jgi:hypothetical protein